MMMAHDDGHWSDEIRPRLLPMVVKRQMIIIFLAFFFFLTELISCDRHAHGRNFDDNGGMH